MGNSRPTALDWVYKAWKADVKFRKWLKTFVNPSSVSLFYGRRLTHQDPLPEVGSVLSRPNKVLQWSTVERTARWFSGIGFATESRQDWNGGALCSAHASSDEIIVDIDAFSILCGRHKQAFAEIAVRSDSIEMFSGEVYEGEVLTLPSVACRVLEAVRF
jgi:hypothetical protein